MTIFIVSLFLPHTVNFILPEGSQQQRRPSSPKRHHHRRESSSELNRRAYNTLFPKRQNNSSTSSSPKLNLLKDHARVFAPISNKLTPLDLLPKTEDGQIQPLTPSDPHSPLWGATGVFNQPRPRPIRTPSSSILKHNSIAAPETELIKRIPSTPKPDDLEELSLEKTFSDAKWTIEPSEQGNGGLLNAIRSAVDVEALKEKLWVGTLGMPTDALEEHVKDTIAEKLEVDHESLTVYVNDSDFNGHYLHFCKTILWPVFHYQIPDNPKSKAYEDHSWVYYKAVNQAFADRIVRNWKRGDIIWIHDYHLLLVPSMVRKQLPDAKIGFFLHTAFPSSEVFRCLSVRRELLEGVLGANLIGFQTQEYCHHFLQTCSRILTVEATNDGVQLEDRFVNVGTFPIGIHPPSLDLRRQSADVETWIRTIKERYQGKRLVVARDKLDNIRGVRQKLLAFELFLNKYPKWRESVVLIQVASSSAEHPELDATVSDIATRVNSLHSSLAHQPLVFLKQDLLFPQYLALISVADVFMVTSLREGMNLTSHEFIHCQDGKDPDKKHGPLILSEFTGSASVFDGHPLLVNPWNYQQCADAINTALEMSPEEREQQWAKLNDAVNAHTTDKWIKNYISTLDKVFNQQACRDNVSIPRLSVNNIIKLYKASSRRLFIVDYEGTLASWGSPTSIILTTPKRAIDALNDLLEDPKNIVYVMSSRMPEELERLFRQVPGLGLIAENGCFVREANREEWIKLFDDEKTQEWKNSLADMIYYFHVRTEGSWVEERHASLVFHYDNAEDPQTAERHASDCANHINDMCHQHRIRAIAVDGAVVAEPTSPNKATAADLVLQHILNRCEKDGDAAAKPDFLFVAGDGRDDEVVFRWANELEDKNVVKNIATVTLGSKNTEAKATLTQGVTGKLSELWKDVIRVWTISNVLLLLGVLSCLGRLAGISQANEPNEYLAEGQVSYAK
ncbi:Trehalose-6-P synthase/phosphatase complex subunit [Emydomyces testavorans]|uniref:Trehalose-6-P synthase/phosphatase complex subunit n=1 Tax=Emydomyces testavorans TaxID=2070801 RepID=A0AAF0DK00_9EURO|nr:Trehalose-6-P synthase/phosphatase complex subunit [Emydomyces testavorans]